MEFRSCSRDTGPSRSSQRSSDQDLIFGSLRVRSNSFRKFSHSGFTPGS
jgi:hypothetical protein